MSAFTPDDIEAIADVVHDVVQRAIARESEQVYTTVEELRQEVASAIEQIRDTAQVLHDNDTVVMAELARTRGDGGGMFAEQVVASWRRFIIYEAEQLGLKVMVPKGRVDG